jgi:glyoxylase-like metal-dependent hydrolase (beta-lactamase superfamily II)
MIRDINTQKGEQTMRIAENVEMLSIGDANGAFYPVLAWDSAHLILIDAGLPGQFDLFRQAIARAGFAVEGLTHILLTHQDMDHIGCVKELLAAAPAAQVLVHEAEAPYLDGTKTPVKLAALAAEYDSLPEEGKAWHDRMKAGYKNRRMRFQKTLRDGEILPICGGIEVVHTPGHTPGHAALYLSTSRILVGGDAVNLLDGALIGPNPEYTLDLEEGLMSFEKIQALHPAGVVSYHGGYWTPRSI